MCGIAGIVDISGRRHVPARAVRAMADALVHRGPDEDGYLDTPDFSLASRRLSIVGLLDGRQPISNEDGSISVVFNGEIFDYREQRAELEAKGHRFRTHTDTELIPHRWEDHGLDLFPHLKGQFAFALWDSKQRLLILARDRFGICPLFYSRQKDDGNEYLLFGSEIKAILASGMVDPRPDPRGINHIFTFFSQPGPVTCFEGVTALLPGHYLRIQLGAEGQPATISEHKYWEIDFPDRGQERTGDTKQLIEEFEAVMLRSVEKRLRADVPVVSYLSGGVDSSTVVALASHIRKEPIPCFTIRIKHPELDETTEAGIVARHIGSDPVVIDCSSEDVLNQYPRLIRAAESPVVDTSCAALMMLAEKVHQCGYKVALTGEGADEWLPGYPWYKAHKLLGMLDFIPGLPLSQMVRRLFLKINGVGNISWAQQKKIIASVGGQNAWLDIYGLMSLSKLRFFTPEMMKAVGDDSPYDVLRPNLERIKKWHPFNRGPYFAGRIHLAGLLLNAKGDRVAMNSSVETRYPFLDEEVFGFLAKLQPHHKMKGLQDKVILRQLAERWLPKSIAWRSKAMFRAPFDGFSLEHAPSYVGQLLSPESLKKTGYFDANAVQHYRESFKKMRAGSALRTTLEMGLSGVLATQLWHQLYIDSTLAEIPAQPMRAAVKGYAAGYVRAPLVEGVR